MQINNPISLVKLEMFQSLQDAHRINQVELNSHHQAGSRNPKRSYFGNHQTWKGYKIIKLIWNFSQIQLKWKTNSTLF